MHTDIATRAYIVALKASSGKTSIEISETTGLSVRQVNRIYARAIERGFDPNHRPIHIQDAYLIDAPRSGRPSKQTDEVKNLILAKVRRDRYGREKACADLAADLSLEGYNISAVTIWRILRKAGLKKIKPTRKPGLTKRMKAERLAWCIQHQDWTLEDWKNVIWSDETSVILLHRRGGYRVWRTPQEALLRSCIRERWKGSSEFMFWGCFSYEQKGPCHCWGPETAQQKRDAEKEIDEMNEALEAYMKEQWELSTGMKRLDLRQLPGRKPQWRWNKKTGRLTRRLGQGIDWYRYRKEILIPKMLPFAKECMVDRPGTLVQEDKAPAHSHSIQEQVYQLHDVKKLLWCGNSPDLNAIEQAWPWMKRRTTKKGAPKSRKEAIQVWQATWEELPQEAIQRWIERIPRHVQEIIKLEGGNEYKEGRGT
jgi:transposase